MSRTYVTKQDDMVDYICWTEYQGRVSGVVDAVFDANPILETYGCYLPAGLMLVLPDVALPLKTTIQLWN